MKALLVLLPALPLLACATPAPPPGAGAPEAVAAPPAVATPPDGNAPAEGSDGTPATVHALATTPADPETVRFATATRAQVEAVAVELARFTAGWTRVRAATEHFLGTPYVHSPLGEGAGVDPDPRIRFDAADCVTFVETALALGNTRSLTDAEVLLDEIRYKEGAGPSFAARLHFFEAQWIPAQIRRGYVVDVTRSIGGRETEVARIEFTPESWASRTGFREFELAWDDAPQGAFELPVVPIDAARRLAAGFPDGLLLNVVREHRPGTPTIVSHTGFVVVKDGVRHLRHAMLANRAVTDEPLADFLERHGRMSQWKVRGVNLLAIRDNTAHAREVLAGKGVRAGAD